MILYREEKNYKKELSIIHSNIKTFEKFYKDQLGKPSRKISEISKKLNKPFTLLTKKEIVYTLLSLLTDGKKENK